MAARKKVAEEVVEKPIVFKIPKSMAACADLAYRVREARYKLQKEAKRYEEFQKELEELLIDTLPKSQASGVSGKVANAKIEKKSLLTVEDWPAFRKYMVRTQGYDMMQKRLNEKAVQDRLDAGKKVPGIKMFDKVKVSLTKVK